VYNNVLILIVYCLTLLICMCAHVGLLFILLLRNIRQ